MMRERVPLSPIEVDALVFQIARAQLDRPKRAILQMLNEETKLPPKDISASLSRLHARLSD
jgi:hypothetical protein